MTYRHPSSAPLWLAALLAVPILTVLSVRAVLHVNYVRNISQHIKRAADANSIDLAVSELTVVVAQLQREGKTSGYTSIVYTTPDEDVGFWFTNLKTSLDQMKGMPVTTSLADRNMILVKLRQTLLDHGKEGEEVTQPQGISLFPYNTLWMLAMVVSVALLLAGLVASDVKF